LPLKEIAKSYHEETEKTGKKEIKELVKEGQELIVQIEKEERGNKGAALTTYISLAGRYLVLMPNNPRAGGVSRRIEGEDRSELKETMKSLVVPEGMGFIVRTAGVGRTAEELQWDMDYLVELWEAISNSAVEKEAPFLIYQERNIIIRAIRDHFRSDVKEIIIDDSNIYEQAKEFMQQIMPHNLHKLKLHTDSTPLFTRFQIESQIESAFNHEVQLPSGGAIVIDHTEALTSVDVNSARATKGGDIEETALNTNVEAAEEVALQLRLRDLGGLFVIDFIDMMPARNQREVENKLREALKMDRARVQIGRISRFGLLEMSRQRLRPSLGESSQHICPRCSGQGNIRGINSLALSILRIIEEESMKEQTNKVIAQTPVEVATYLLNEKRLMIQDIEARQNISLIIIPNPNMETPHYTIAREKVNQQNNSSGASYTLTTEPENNEQQYTANTPVSVVEPTVKMVVPNTPAPTAGNNPDKLQSQTKGFFQKIWSSMTASEDENDVKEAAPKTPSPTDKNNSNRNSNRNKNNNNSNRKPQNKNRNNRNNRNKHKEDNRNKNEEASSNENENSNSSNKKSDQNKPGHRPNSRNRSNNRRRRPNRDNNVKENDESISSPVTAPPVQNAEEQPKKEPVKAVEKTEAKDQQTES